MSFLIRLSEWGKKNLRRKDPGDVLMRLYVHDGRAIEDISAMFKMDSRKVRFWLCLFGVPLRTTEPEIVRASRRIGFKSLRDYFKKRWGHSFERMGAELEINPSTVSKYYGEYVSEISAFPAKR